VPFCLSQGLSDCSCFLLLLPALLLLVSFARAQEPLVMHGKLPGPQLDLTPYTFYYEDLSGDTLPLPVIQTKPFRPFAQKRNAPARSFDQSVMVTWLRFTLRNSHPTDTLKLIYSVGQGHGQITTFKDNRKIDVTGFDRVPQRGRPDPFAVPLLLPPGTGHTYWVRVINATGGLIPISSELMTVEAGWKKNLQRARDKLLFLILMSALAGCVLFMGAYALYHYRLTRDRAFLYYCLYAGFGLFHIIKDIDFLFNVGVLMQFYPAAMLRYPFQFEIILIFYALFLKDQG
jgi:hypothetical protein